MSTPIEDTRQKLYALVKSFHASEYATPTVNFPGRMKTDVEKVGDEDFITVELSFETKGLGLPARQCVRVSGLLVLNQFVRKNSGEKIFTTYSDKVFTYFSLETIDSVTFEEVQPFDNSGIPGFDGRMNSARFYTDYFNV